MPLRAETKGQFCLLQALRAGLLVGFDAPTVASLADAGLVGGHLPRGAGRGAVRRDAVLVGSILVSADNNTTLRLTDTCDC